MEWATVTPEAFLQALEPLRAEVAGVPAVMQRFRDGDESLIACDRLSIEESADGAAILATGVNRNIFFDTLTETTRLLQASALRALAATRPAQDGWRALISQRRAAISWPVSTTGF